MNNPGGELKTFGNMIKVIGIIVSIVLGISVMVLLSPLNGVFAFLFGIVMIAIGCFLTWLVTIFVIAFGELTENSTVIRRHLEMGRGTPSTPTNTPQAARTQKCSLCGAENPASAFLCEECGGSLSGSAAKKVSVPASLGRLNVCPKCGMDIPSGTKYCVQCGTAAKGQ